MKVTSYHIIEYDASLPKEWQKSDLSLKNIVPKFSNRETAESCAEELREQARQNYSDLQYFVQQTAYIIPDK